MGIKVEFNPDLALRAYRTLGRRPEECLPEKLETGKIHNFLKEGQRNYWLEGNIPLIETKGNQQLSKPLASIKILEATHFIENNLIYTRGKYQIQRIFDNKKNYFNGFQEIK
jgi:hypothetical protein